MGHILVEETDKPKNKISEMDNMLGGNKCHGKSKAWKGDREC